MSSRGWLRALYDRLLSGAGDLLAPADLNTTTAPPLDPDALPARIGRYAILRKLGAGGMGVVYAASDERLARTVALKTMGALVHDERARRRFWREARAAASVNHPNVCQIYEVDEDGPEPFLVMELLDGESLADRLARGPLTVAESLPIGLGILSALTALHARGIVHRDLKPSNVFLTRHGVKVLDFGVARLDVQPNAPDEAGLTPSGVLVGTPAYMAPELVTGEAEPRSDLFAVGAILFEMLAGRPAFQGRTIMAILHDAMYEHPPALTGSPAVVAMDRVIRRALAKRADDRPGSADALARELEAVRGLAGDDTATLARAMTRLVVLPFRVLRPDPESDFLAFSLSDAIASSLSTFESVVVRSSAVAARFAGKAAGEGTPDLKALATEADVDRVVMGTLLRSGELLRTTAQLVEAPGGRLLTSLTVESSLGDLFRLQDDIARRVVQALALPLVTAGTSTPTPTPPHARAYELYLRANELARSYSGMPQARELYRQCLEHDARFAPAWAQLGRCHRVIGKYIDGAATSEADAEAALQRALDLNPRLSVAHKYYANLEADIGRARHALMRLLGEAERHGNDPELFAGLVHACRYCGLYEESVAAHHEARRLDPNVPTSYAQTLLMMGDLDRLFAIDRGPLLTGGGADEEIQVIALGLADRRDDARRTLHEVSRPNIPAFESWVRYLLAWLERRPDDMAANMAVFGNLKIQEDPEAIFQEGWLLCDVGRGDEGLAYLERAVARGYFPTPTLTHAPQFVALQDHPRFQALLAQAEAGRRDALARFRESGGERLLGR